MSLQVELEHYRNVLIVRLRGELDHHTAETVKQKKWRMQLSAGTAIMSFSV